MKNDVVNRDAIDDLDGSVEGRRIRFGLTAGADGLQRRRTALYSGEEELMKKPRCKHSGIHSGIPVTYV